MATGNSNQGIADRLVITQRAVEVRLIDLRQARPAFDGKRKSRRVLAVLLFLNR